MSTCGYRFTDASRTAPGPLEVYARGSFATGQSSRVQGPCQRRPAGRSWVGGTMPAPPNSPLLARRGVGGCGPSAMDHAHADHRRHHRAHRLSQRGDALHRRPAAAQRRRPPLPQRADDAGRRAAGHERRRAGRGQRRVGAASAARPPSARGHLHARTRPSPPRACERYLGSGVIKGIGPEDGRAHRRDVSASRRWPSSNWSRSG